MFLPPEILLSILEELRTDREALQKIRLVDKYLCQVATDILFGDFSVHYGFKHSVPQLKAIIKSPGLQPYIRSLHLPSESFFPIAKNFVSRVAGGYRFPWSRDLSKEVEPPAQLNCYEQQTDARNYRGYLEVPTNRKARFDFAVKRYKKEYDTYRKTLLDFLEKCASLRAIHVTTGLGYDAERSAAWSSMIRTDVFPILAKHKIKKLEISAASLDCLLTMLNGYDDEEALQSGQLPVFSSVTSLTIKVQYEATPTYPYYPEAIRTGFRNKLNGFLSVMPNLTAYSIGNTELMRLAMDFLPTSPAYANMASLDINSMFFTDEMFESFKSMVSSMPLLTDLTLDTISLCLPANTTVEYYPERRVPLGDLPEDGSTSIFQGGLFGSYDRDVPTYSLDNHPATMTWAYVFEILQKKLPRLTDFSVKRLTYGGADSRIHFRPMHLFYMPVQDREDYNRRDFQRFARNTWNMELISTLEGDYLALARLKQVLNEKRRKFGLPELKCDSKSEGFGPRSSDNDIDLLGDYIPQFEHRTKNKRIIKVGCQHLWEANGFGNAYNGLALDSDLYYWEA